MANRKTKRKMKMKRKTKTKTERHCQEGTDCEMKIVRPPDMLSDSRNSDIMMFRERVIEPWEKEFCLEVGLFTWEHFLEAKQHTKNHYKVLHWNDSAAKEAFYAARYRYFARINNLPYAESGLLMDPDMFIDEIKWDDDLYTQLLRRRAQLIAKLEKEDEEEDYRYYSQLIEQVRLCQAYEV